MIDRAYIASRLTAEAPWCESHGAEGDHLGMGMLYYALVHAFRARVAVCLGSGGGFVPRLMRQAQRDLGIAGASRTILVDANRPEAGWGAPAWLPERSLFRREFGDVELVLETTADAAARFFEPAGIRIDYLHVDADHSFERCLEDFHAYRRFLHPGSLVTLHDSRLPSAGVRAVVEHLRTLPDCDVLDLPGVGTGTALVRIRAARPQCTAAPLARAGDVEVTRKPDAPELPPLQMGWRYLESEAFSMRGVIAAHWLRPCGTVIELGGYRTSVAPLLTGAHRAVLVVDPHGPEEERSAAGGRPCRVVFVRARFQDLAWSVPRGADYGLVMLGLELHGLDEGDWRELCRLVDGARVTVIEFPPSWAPSCEQFERIRASTRTRVRFQTTLELSGNDLGDLSGSWPARTERRLFVLEPG